MKKLLVALFLLTNLVVTSTSAQVINRCFMIDESTVTASGNSDILDFIGVNPENKKAQTFTFTLKGVNGAGSSPTLDVQLQSCKDTTAASCKDLPFAFDRCTTGTCTEYVDVNTNLVNVFPYFRAVYTIGGTSSPSYDVEVEACYP